MSLGRLVMGYTGASGVLEELFRNPAPAQRPPDGQDRVLTSDKRRSVEKFIATL